MKSAKDFLSAPEIKDLTSKSDLQGVMAVFTSWLIIALSGTLVALYANPLTVVIALILIGGRQLGLAVLMHEAAHRTLAKRRWLNDVLGAWICAAPMGFRVDAYRTHHLGHHVHTSTDRDPDLSLVAPFPTSRRTLIRKFARDILGISGLRRLVGVVMMDLGYLEYTAAANATAAETKPTPTIALRNGFANLGPKVLANSALFGLAWSLGQPMIYLLWLGSYLTTFSLFLRMRSIAEHACTTKGGDPFSNTRTTQASWLARLTVAPHQVNFHIEHHLLMTVPFFRLPTLHRILRERGAFTGAGVARNYIDVLRTVTLLHDAKVGR